LPFPVAPLEFPLLELLADPVTAAIVEDVAADVAVVGLGQRHEREHALPG